MPALKFTDEEVRAIFGNEAAEDETVERLKEYYFKGRTYEKVAADLPLRILVGHKGTGKSALFRISREEDNAKGQVSVLIRPDDIHDIGTDTSDILKTIRLWKQGLLVIIANKVIGSFGLDKKSNLSQVLTKGGKVFSLLEETFKPYLTDKISVDGPKKELIRQFLKSSSITVYLDDLDRGWQGRKEDIVRISALMNALRDLCNDNPGIRFRVALRSDVYFLVRTSDESTDKFETSVIWYSWTNHEILALLAKRIETFFKRKTDEPKLLAMPQVELAKYLGPVMGATFTGKGKWKNVPIYKVLMSLTRKRPRDLVKLCTLAAHSARDSGQHKIGTQDFLKVFEQYSQERVLDTINEYKTELPDIERLLMGMRPSKAEKETQMEYVYSTADLLQKIKNIQQHGVFRAWNGAEWTPQQLAQFMYKINFLTARKRLPNGEIQRKYFEESRYLSSSAADFGYDWEVHPAYRWALQPDRIDAIYEKLELSSDLH